MASLHVEQQRRHHAHRLLPLHPPLLALAHEPCPEAMQRGVATLALEGRTRHVELPRYVGLQVGYVRLQDWVPRETRPDQATSQGGSLYLARRAAASI